jgi:hypothetical protein
MNVLAVTTDFDNWAMVIAGYVIVLGGIAAFTARLMAKARRLSRQVPDEAKPWT